MTDKIKVGNIFSTSSDGITWQKWIVTKVNADGSYQSSGLGDAISEALEALENERGQMNYCLCWRCNGEPNEEETYEDDPDRLHDEMKEDLP